MSKANLDTGTKIAKLHQLLTKADQKEAEARTLCFDAMSLGLLSLGLFACSSINTALELNLKLTVSSGWLRSIFFVILFFFGSTKSQEGALYILSHLRPNGIFPGITTHPAHQIKYLYCTNPKIEEYHQSLSSMVNCVSLLLRVIYVIAGFVCFMLPIIRYLLSEVNQPELTIHDPLARQATNCFERNCLDEFSMEGTQCIMECQDTLHYAIAQFFTIRSNGSSTSSIIYNETHLQINQIQAQNIISQFNQTSSFSIIEWCLKVMQGSRQKKRKYAINFSKQITSFRTIPVPKVQFTYAGILIKLAPRVGEQNTHYNQFLDGLQAIWQSIFLNYSWNYITTCRSISQFEKRMNAILAPNCKLKPINHERNPKVVIYKIMPQKIQKFDIGYGKHISQRTYLVELDRALMSAGFSTYHINGVLYISYQDLGSKLTTEIKQGLQRELQEIYQQESNCHQIAEKLNQHLNHVLNLATSSGWTYELYNFSDTACVYYLNLPKQLSPNSEALNGYQEALAYAFEGNCIIRQTEGLLKLVFNGEEIASPSFLEQFNEQLHNQKMAYRVQNRAGPSTSKQRTKHKKQKRVPTLKANSKPTACIATLPQLPNRIDFGGGVTFFKNDEDRPKSLSARAFPLEVDFLASRTVFGFIREKTLQQAEHFTNRTSIFNILARGRTHGRKAVKTGNSAQGIQIQSETYINIHGQPRNSFCKIKTTHNLGIWGHKEQRIVDGQTYHLIEFDGVPGPRH